MNWNQDKSQFINLITNVKNVYFIVKGGRESNPFQNLEILCWIYKKFQLWRSETI